MQELRQSALHWLSETDAEAKANGVLALITLNLTIATAKHPCASEYIISTIPGRPSKPDLVAPLSLPKRSMRTAEGRAALIHALTHIEFNAINLALDAIWRFDNLPQNYYTDWLKVAVEEAYHFTLLNTHLKTL